MKINSAFFLLLFSGFFSIAQNNTPPYNLTSKYFRRELTDYKTVFVDDAEKDIYYLKYVSKKSKRFLFETLYYSENKAVIAVSGYGKANAYNLYVFWIKDNGWKIKTIKTLEFSGMMVEVDQSKGMDDNSISKEYDKILKNRKQNSPSVGTFEEYLYETKHARLMFASDSTLADYFAKNINRFNTLLNKLKGNAKSKDEIWRFDSNSGYKNDLKNILLSSVSSRDNSKVINFVIGDLSNGSVGYFYCENKDDVPEMTEERYIMIRKLGNGWYLYKTL